MTQGPIRLARPDLGDAELAAIAEVLATGQLTMGPQVAAFERAVAEAVGTADAVAVSTGTAALHLAMLALGIGPGDEVIVPAYTFPATANAVELCGGRAVLVDVDPETFLARADHVASAVTPRTRAVLAVHLFGRPVAWEELQTAVPQEVALVEDAAGALGASLPRHALRGARAPGVPVVPPAEDRHDRRGGRGDDRRGRARVRRAAAAKPRHRRRSRRHRCARLQLPAARRPLRARASLSSSVSSRSSTRASGWPRWYTERLAHLVGTPSADEGDRHGWQAYVVSLDRRDEALAGLRSQGIEVQIGTYAVNRLSAYRDRGSFPGADAAFERALALPLATTMTEDDVDRVSTALQAYV